MRKLTVIYLLILTAFLAVQPECVYAQQTTKEIKMSVKKERLPDVLWQLEKQTGYKMVFSIDDLNPFYVTANIKAKTLSDALRQIIGSHPISYRISGKYVTFQLQREQRNSRSVLGTHRVTGIVCDESGDPLPGATVRVVGKNIIAVADNNGAYSIDIAEGDKLQFSSLGMKTIVVSGKGGKVTLEEDNTLDDVIVTGYGNINRGMYVGAVTQVRGEDVLVAAENSIDQMLQGVIPGVSVVNTTGKVGGTPKIRIRGTSTILGNQEPLWVVDDVIQTNPNPIPNDASPISSDMDQLMETAGNAISWLNPADIETITVLKDASATAIYGSQAANGVIVITTKKAKVGHGLSVSYSGNVSITQKPSYGLYDLMNSQEAMRFQQEMYEDRNQYTYDIVEGQGYAGLLKMLLEKQISRGEYERLFHNMETINTDWFDLLFRTPVSQQHNLSVSNAGTNLSSRFSVGLNNSLGEAKGNDMTSVTASSNTTWRLSNKLIIDLSMNGSYRKSTNFAFGVSPYNFAMNTSRTIPAYNDDGTLYYYMKRGNRSYSYDNYYYGYNILNEIDNTGTRTTSSTFQANIGLKWNVIKHVQLQGDASFSMLNSKNKSYATEYSNYISNIRGYEYGQVQPNSVEENASILPYGGMLNQQNTNSLNYSFRGAVVYTNTFEKKHNVTLNLGIQATSNKMDGDASLRYGYLKYRGETFATVPYRTELANVVGYVNGTDLHRNMTNGTSITNTISNQLSEYFTAVYSFDNRYVVNLNGRLDASNRFGQDENKKFNPSFSIGTKWRIGEEHFMEWARSWYDMFDISFAYGWRGNAVTSVSPYLIAKDGGLSTIFRQYVLNIVSLPYPDLGWEKTRDWNLGIDFSFLNGRISATFSVFNKKSEVLTSHDVPVEYGMSSAYVNGAIMRNKGYDLIISVTPIRTKDWTWSLSFNTGLNRNEVTRVNMLNTPENYLNGTAVVSGVPYGTIYAFDFAGLDPETGHPMFNKLDVETAPDDFKDYLVKAGCTDPDISGGINTSIKYKRVTLRAMFAMSLGAQAYLPQYFATNGAPRSEENMPRYLFDRWRQPGDELKTEIPSIPDGNPNNMYISLEYAGTTSTGTTTTASFLKTPYWMYNYSTARIADTDFIRCRLLSLQYDIPKKWSKRLGVRNAYVSASLTNPFFIAFDKKWEGRDPETANWPARRSLSFNVNLTF